MTTAHMTDRDYLIPARANAAATPGPVGWAGIIIGTVFGLISGIAQYTALYIGATNHGLLLLFTLTGAVIGTVVGATLGIGIDKFRAWRAG